MFSVIKTEVISGEDIVNETITLYPPVYLLICKDSADNTFEIETNEETYIRATNFLDSLREV